MNKELHEEQPTTGTVFPASSFVRLLPPTKERHGSSNRRASNFT